MFEYDQEKDEFNEIFSSDKLITSNEFRFPKRTSVSAYSFRSSRNSIWSNRICTIPSIIRKNGRLNTFQVKIPKKYVVYFRDLGNTLLNIRWRWIIIALFFVNFAAFFIFGLMWMWIAYISGDYEKDVKDECIVNTKTLTGYVLLSIETMLTIGYGYRYPTEKCVQGWIVPFLQALISVGIQGALVSAIYVKISKPGKTNTVSLFSRKAVVCLRNGKLCFIIRIADLVGKITIGTNVSMYFVNKNQNDNNLEPFQMKQMKIEPYGFPILPIEIVHVIDSYSPFWTLTPYELLMYPLEVIVVAEGAHIVTGQPSQNRTSYTNSDIMWGHRFASCVDFDRKMEKYMVNYKNFNHVYPFDTPLCSAEELVLIAEEYAVDNNSEE